MRSDMLELFCVCKTSFKHIWENNLSKMTTKFYSNENDEFTIMLKVMFSVN